jgi:hypothetical protein
MAGWAGRGSSAECKSRCAGLLDRLEIDFYLKFNNPISAFFACTVLE